MPSSLFYPNWSSEGAIVNPLINALLADTGALTSGTYRFMICGGSTAAGGVRIQWRNAANDANIFEHVLPLAAGQETCFDFDMVTAADNERLRVIAYNAIVGTCQVSIENRA